MNPFYWHMGIGVTCAYEDRGFFEIALVIFSIYFIAN